MTDRAGTLYTIGSDIGSDGSVIERGRESRKMGGLMERIDMVSASIVVWLGRRWRQHSVCYKYELGVQIRCSRQLLLIERRLRIDRLV